jgi:prepilin-type processing-associated H-X9-DG protein
LAALLLPSLQSARQKARVIECLSNMRQLTAAWLLYVPDNRGCVVGAESNNDWDWVTNRANVASSITGGALYRYVNTLSVYRCQADTSGHVWSYSIPGPIGGQGGPQPVNWIQASISKPSTQLAFCEESDIRGGAAWGNRGAFWIRGPTGSWTAWTSATDWPAWGRHRTSMNLAFADGHAETWMAADPVSPTIIYAGQVFDSTNPDYQRFWAVYYP